MYTVGKYGDTCAGVVSVPFPPFLCEDVTENLVLHFNLAAKGSNRQPFADRQAIDAVRKVFKALEGTDKCA